MILFSSPTNDGRSATVNGKVLTLVAIKTIQDELLDQIELELDRLLLGQFTIPDGVYIHDEPQELTSGYGFVTE